MKKIMLLLLSVTLLCGCNKVNAIVAGPANEHNPVIENPETTLSDHQKTPEIVPPFTVYDFNATITEIMELEGEPLYMSQEYPVYECEYEGAQGRVMYSLPRAIRFDFKSDDAMEMYDYSAKIVSEYRKVYGEPEKETIEGDILRRTIYKWKFSETSIVVDTTYSQVTHFVVIWFMNYVP